MIKNIYVEKNTEFDVKSQITAEELREFLQIPVVNVRIINCYTLSGEFDEAEITTKILSEAPTDKVFTKLNIAENSTVFAYKYIDGQYDNKADFATQCIKLICSDTKINVVCKQIVVIGEDLNEEQIKKIKQYFINPVDSHEVDPESTETIVETVEDLELTEYLDKFTKCTDDELLKLIEHNELSMDLADVKFTQEYFIKQQRDPTITELKVLDTYWSDHCRHTTFSTIINNVEFAEGELNSLISQIFEDYKAQTQKEVTLMNIATAGTKILKKQGLLGNLDESDEINACTIKASVDVDGKTEEWLILFKNETHNHPTEIEPYGGAATCLGGAIRDPLSGRAYVYQSMRVSGAGNPLELVNQTLQDKLPQRKITTEAANGFSSYGNQFGIATGGVYEVYDDGYKAKRLEVGAVVGAVKLENVKREAPKAGDVVVLLGGKTGRDGIGGATGSSRSHTEKTVKKCGAQVQKGNPVEERKLQRLMLKPEVSKLIKKCNDFGAGGVCVAVGELATSININLDLIPKKYINLNGTELAISESQERMAVVLDANDLEKFIILAESENIEATKIAYITKNGKLIMTYKGQTIVDLDYDFIEKNGAKRYQERVLVDSKPVEIKRDEINSSNELLTYLSGLNVALQCGLTSQFDSTIGRGSVTVPFGGVNRLTPTQGMTAKVPVRNGITNTTTVMAYGFDLELSKQNQFLGAINSITASIIKTVCCGASPEGMYLTLQEYYERLGNDPTKWAKPLTALLGAYYVQTQMGIAAIGGKDSMSGTYKELTVPPTLISFALNMCTANNTVTPELKLNKSYLVLIKHITNNLGITDFAVLKQKLLLINKLMEQKLIYSAFMIEQNNIMPDVIKMALGNGIGFCFDDSFDRNGIYKYGVLLEVADLNILNGMDYALVGETRSHQNIECDKFTVTHEECSAALLSTFEPVFSAHSKEGKKISSLQQVNSIKTAVHTAKAKVGAPRVFMPIFPGTNCELDMHRAFTTAGAVCDSAVFCNQNQSKIEQSIAKMVSLINNCNILALPGGFSAGDQPDGSAKFIVAVFRNPYVTEAINNFLTNTDGLILGICNGFQALIKLGLLPYGNICDYKKDSPTLTYNTINKHISNIYYTKVVSKLSPWYCKSNIGDCSAIAMSHGEGRFIANSDEIQKLITNGQISTQYVDLNGNATSDAVYNPNGSSMAVEGICSPDGRILGKMGHSERYEEGLYANIPFNKNDHIFDSAMSYFS